MLKLKLFVPTLSLFLLVGNAKAKDWRGIVPLASTREDVIRIFKQCSEVNPSCEFRAGHENVHIEFSGTSTSRLHECSKQLRPDTVLLIEVIPEKALDLKPLGIDRNRLRVFKLNSPTSAKYRGYIDDNRGLVVKTYEGKVVQLDYIAEAKDRHLCQSYYENPESFVEDIFLSHTPAIALNCPPGKTQAGKRISFLADTTANAPKITFLWTVSTGRIIAGQGTRNITVDTTGLQGQLIKATVTLGRVTASCDVQISP